MVADRLRSQLLSRSPWRDARWLVIAPHADDETLGCAALIDETARNRCLAGVAFLTDGGSSHSCGTARDRLRLVALRQQEARAALRVLAPGAKLPLFLSWPDADPYSPDAAARAATLGQLGTFCRTHGVDAIAVTGRDEPHCDHVAAFEIAAAVAKFAARKTTVFEYIVWAKHPPGSNFAVVRTAPINLGRRRLALAQHRSQLTPLHGEGFRVPESMQRMTPVDLLYTKAKQ